MGGSTDHVREGGTITVKSKSDSDIRSRLLTTEKVGAIYDITGNLIKAEIRQDSAAKAFFYDNLPELKSSNFIQDKLREIINQSTPNDSTRLLRLELNKSIEEMLIKYDVVFLNFLAFRNID